MLQFLAPLTAISILNRTSSTSVCCFCVRQDRRSGGFRWEGRTRNGQQRFRFDEESRANGGEKGAESGFGSAAKQRNWWSDDEQYCGYDYEDEDEDDFEGFGASEGSIGFSWIFKVVQAFGWMVPAAIISTLLGTGTNTIIMALALPLAQSALSLLIDTFSGVSYNRQRPKSGTKKQRHGRARMGVGEQDAKNGRGGRGYGPWVPPKEKEAKTAQNFGGWDELDNVETASNVPETTPTQDPYAGKLSRRKNKKETPLLLRLLIAFFPFLGSWTKLL